MRSYEAARSLYSFLAVCAWVAIGIGIVAAIATMSATSGMRSFGGRSSELAVLVSALPGLGISFVGFLGLALVQNGRASVDTAEYTQQMLQLSRQTLEVSRQALRQHDASASQSFSAVASASSAEQKDTPGASFSAERDDAKGDAPKLGLTNDLINYRGIDIIVKEGKFLVRGKTFYSRMAAEKQIDRMLR